MTQSGTISAKSYRQFAVTDGLLAKVVAAVKKGEADARRTGQVRSFEVFILGHRQNIIIGRLMVIPPKVADSLEDFPTSLLYGAMVREVSPEAQADLINYKLGESEFDEYEQGDLSAIKDRLFRDNEGKYHCVVMFIPAWHSPREYVTFKFVADEAQLATRLRHLVFAAYYDPAVSSAFDHLVSDADSAKTDVTDITPKLVYPFLAENILKQYPDLDRPELGDVKVAGGRKPKVCLAADTANELVSDLLDPKEKEVLDGLTDELKAKVDGEVVKPSAVVGEESFKAAASKTAYGYELVQTTALKQREDSLIRQLNDVWLDPHERRQLKALLAAVREKLSKLTKAAADAGLRRQPDYGAADSHTVEDNALAAKGGAALEETNPLIQRLKAYGLIVRIDKGSNADAPLFSVKLTDGFIAWSIVDGFWSGDIVDQGGTFQKTISTSISVDGRDLNKLARELFQTCVKLGVQREESKLASAPEHTDTCPECKQTNRNWKPLSKKQWESFHATGHADNDLTRKCEHCGTEYPFKFIKVKSAALKTNDAVVLEKDGAKLLEKDHPREPGVTQFVAVAPNGAIDYPVHDGSRVLYNKPEDFPPSFRIAVEQYLKQRKVASRRLSSGARPKMAEVPLTFDNIWSEITTDLGAAPSIELKEEPKADASAKDTSGEAENAPAVAKGTSGEGEPKKPAEPKPGTPPPAKNRLDKMHDRRGEDADGKPNVDVKKQQTEDAAKEEADRKKPVAPKGEAKKPTPPVAPKKDVPTKTPVKSEASDKKEEPKDKQAAYTAQDGVCEDCGSHLDSWGTCPNLPVQEIGTRGISSDGHGTFCGGPRYSPAKGQAAGDEFDINMFKRTAAYSDKDGVCPNCYEHLDAFGVCPNVPAQELGVRSDPHGRGTFCGGPTYKSAPGQGAGEPFDVNMFKRTACQACAKPIGDSPYSEIAPGKLAHGDCIRRVKSARLDWIIPGQVLANHFPRALRSIITHHTSANAKPTLDESERVREQGRFAAFNMFIPGKALTEFDPQLQHDIVDAPESGNAPMISDVDLDPNAGGGYIPTSAVPAMGIGNQGKPEILEGAPLHKDDEIRGPMFQDEFNAQYKGLPVGAFRAMGSLQRINKKAGTDENKAQFTDFLKKVVGEIAATFLTVFKVTQRPLMDAVPGLGEVQLSNVEQSAANAVGNTFNIINTGSRVKFLLSQLNDGDIKDAINEAWAQAAVWSDSPNGGFNYEVFVRAESVDTDSMILKYKFVTGTRGL